MANVAFTAEHGRVLEFPNVGEEVTIFSDKQINALGIEKLPDVFYSRDSLPVEYFTTYGTLNFMEGNWERFLDGNSQLISCDKLLGFRYNGGLSAQYTGNTEDVLHTFTYRVHQTNWSLTNMKVDNLEGVRRGAPETTMSGYRPLIIKTLDEYGNQVLSKFYDLQSWTKADVNGYEGFVPVRKKIIPMYEHAGIEVVKQFLSFYPKLDKELKTLEKFIAEQDQKTAEIAELITNQIERG